MFRRIVLVLSTCSGRERPRCCGMIPADSCPAREHTDRPADKGHAHHAGKDEHARRLCDVAAGLPFLSGAANRIDRRTVYGATSYGDAGAINGGVIAASTPDIRAAALTLF